MKEVRAAGSPATERAAPPAASSCRSAARIASSRRLATPYLRSSDETWLSTVRTEMCSLLAIWVFVRCRPTAASTSASRSETSLGGMGP